MRKSREETAATRQRILESAIEEIRRNGIAGTGVAATMKGAGLSQGGFYRHFDSKDALVFESLEHAWAQFVDPFENYVDGKGGRTALLEATLAALTPSLRDCGAACPLVSLGSELARESDDVREMAAASLRRLIDAIARQLDDVPAAQAEAEAWGILSTVFGALTLARIVPDNALSTTILAQVRSRLKAQICAGGQGAK